MGNDFAGMPRQIDEKVEFLGREMEAAVLHSYRPRLEVNVEISHLDQLLFHLFPNGGTAKCCPNARQQLVRTEWLGHIIVSAGIERLHLRAFFPSYRENNNWNLGFRANLAT